LLIKKEYISINDNGKLNKKIKTYSIMFYLTLLVFTFYNLFIDAYFIYNIELIKSGFLLYSLIFLSSKIIHYSNHNPLILKIDGISDKVLFDDLDSVKAINELKLIIFGLEFEGVISPYIIKHFELTEIFNIDFENAKISIDTFVNHTSEKDKAFLFDSLEENNLKLIDSFASINCNLKAMLSIFKKTIKYEFRNDKFAEAVKIVSDEIEIKQKQLEEISSSFTKIRKKI
jgi:hypothetical protein